MRKSSIDVLKGGVTASSREFVYGKFSDFYRSQSAVIPPASLDQREFAFFLFKERIMLRHKGFARVNDLKSFLSETVPSDVYHSCAYYENPEFEMDKKGWLGADLVFDIDADHIPTSCNKIHDEWTCGKCGFSGKGITPETCPICESQKFDTKTWPCELCLKSAKEETAKLIDMLEKDFGFSYNELHVFFSGHRGYHVHVENEAVKTLDAMARKEIVDYVSGIGLSVFDKKGKDIRELKDNEIKNSVFVVGSEEGLPKKETKRNCTIIEIKTTLFIKADLPITVFKKYIKISKNAG
jgi:DNA primase small subunit